MYHSNRIWEDSMPIYFYWGDDEFSLSRAVTQLRDRILDPNWASFNYDKIQADQPESIIQGLNQAMTPPFGMGDRLVWLANTTVCQRCSEDLLSELTRTLPLIPDNTVLLLTNGNKPDGRIKSTKLLQKHAEIREFATIPPWKTEQIEKRVQQMAQDVGLKLTGNAVQLLADAIGNDTRQLHTELDKLRIFAGESGKPLSDQAIAPLITTSTQSSLKLASTIRDGNTARALTLLQDLFARNEPALRMVATLVGQFRTWLWVKLMVESGERDDKAIAQAAEISNPKRIYFLKQEVRSLPLPALQQALPILLELEVGLKQGAEAIALCQTKVIELCQLFQASSISKPSKYKK